MPTRVDGWIAELPRHSDTEVAALYARLERFYFAFVPDSARARPFLARLGRTAASPPLPPAPSAPFGTGPP